MRPAPPVVSSAGWKTKRTFLGSFSPALIMRAVSSARPSSMAVWPSCPQACMRPGLSEAKKSPVHSVTGSASMSARRATVSSAPASKYAHTPPLMGEKTSAPSGSSTFLT